MTAPPSNDSAQSPERHAQRRHAKFARPNNIRFPLLAIAVIAHHRRREPHHQQRDSHCAVLGTQRGAGAARATTRRSGTAIGTATDRRAPRIPQAGQRRTRGHSRSHHRLIRATWPTPNQGVHPCADRRRSPNPRPQDPPGQPARCAAEASAAAQRRPRSADPARAHRRIGAAPARSAAARCSASNSPTY